MTTVVADDASNAANVFHCILKKHEVHDSVGVVVFAQGLVESFSELINALELIVELVLKRGDKICEDEWLRVLRLEVLLEGESGEALLNEVGYDVSVSGDVVIADEAIAVNSLALVHP